MNTPNEIQLIVRCLCIFYIILFHFPKNRFYPLPYPAVSLSCWDGQNFELTSAELFFNFESPFCAPEKII